MDDLGDRIKRYEAIETERLLLPLCPVYARIDGRCFSAFTRGMGRPFDEDLSRVMVATVSTLVEKTHALIGYTQSDEISLLWHAPEPRSELLFGGRIQKMVSVLAGLATAAFTRALLDSDHAERAALMPHFDARVFALPTRDEAANAFLWRELDATKNAVSMAAGAFYSAKALHGKKSAEKQEMLFAKGVNFNDYPPAFKRGTFVRRVTRERTLGEVERLAIPEAHRPSAEQTFMRSSVESVFMPRFGSVTNRVGVLFDGEEPVIAQGMVAMPETGTGSAAQQDQPGRLQADVP